MSTCYSEGDFQKYFTENMQKEFHKSGKLKKRNIVALVSAYIVDGYPTNVILERDYEW